ncbi:hypothetical protein CFO_g5094 [Ceratocystis platani]|uniref:BZIP domain-containing protein n=1 Tax=Ceratocystis fimbriata f. sp. platani TaxID=88771 RepID=A0A0F8BJU5_CERFI|nr:hypothetical protein CFO_g5094 [Ceratocystis platani]
MSITKHNKEKVKVKEDTGGEESMESTPEAEQATASTTTPSSVSNAQEVQQPKRKGGRKPIYATSEERKQRNRQAQAAFRERRIDVQAELRAKTGSPNLGPTHMPQNMTSFYCYQVRYHPYQSSPTAASPRWVRSIAVSAQQARTLLKPLKLPYRIGAHIWRPRSTVTCCFRLHVLSNLGSSIY